MKKKILIVDDEEVIRMLYGEELEEDGYSVVTAGSGHGLIDMIGKEKPDLVVLDIKMAEHDGLDLLQDIRKDYYNIPVILSNGIIIENTNKKINSKQLINDSRIEIS